MLGDGYLVLAYTRCNDPRRVGEWADWYDDEHLPELLRAGADAISRFELTQKPVPGMPSVGFSHVALYEFRGAQAERRLERTLAEGQRLHERGDVHPNHCLIDLDVLVAHGVGGTKSVPSASLEGHVVAYVLPNQAGRYDEWDAWYDATHLPDMMASGAFVAGSRWRRRTPRAYGANDVTLYDVAGMSMEDAVERSAAVLPGLVEHGRKLDCHVGGLSFVVRRTGRHGGAGLVQGRNGAPM